MLDAAPLYSQVAEQIHALIRAGTLRPGERVPSVRRLSRQQGVSVATVLQAYQRLEDAGVIEARPQSAPAPRGAAYIELGQHIDEARIREPLQRPTAVALVEVTGDDRGQLGVELG